jgi:zinc transport system substrate-binding protein
MDGVAEPQLLIPANASPHAYALKPSDARALSGAELVVWVGEALEVVLEKPLHALAGKAQVLELSTLEEMQLLPTREGGVWPEEVEHEAEHAHHGHGEMDTHLWLSPANARQIVTAVAERLSDLDGANAERYRANADNMLRRISELERQLRGQLAPVRELPYIVFHDAYHYFEKAFLLHPVGAIAVSPDRRPGARRLVEIRDTIRQRGALCVFSEPQFRPATVQVVLEGSDARHGVLDPLGAELSPGKQQWFDLMQGLADNLVGCLAGR